MLVCLCIDHYSMGRRGMDGRVQNPGPRETKLIVSFLADEDGDSSVNAVSALGNCHQPDLL